MPRNGLGDGGRARKRLRTLAKIPLEVELHRPGKTPIFRVIAQEAAQMRDRECVSAPSRHFGVDFHTTDKTIRWYWQR